MTKYNVHDPKTGEKLAEEWLENNQWVYQKFSNDGSLFGSRQLGTYPHPGIRRQFTGLTDKNGVEVYGQDICYEDCVGTINQFLFKIKIRVEWHEFGWVRRVIGTHKDNKYHSKVGDIDRFSNSVWEGNLEKYHIRNYLEVIPPTKESKE